MVVLTDAAMAAGKEKLAKYGKPGEKLRIGVAGSGCNGYELCLICDGGDLRPKDTELKFGDLLVVMDARSLAFLADATIDYEKTIMNEGFVVRSDKIKSYCSCGTSFST